MPDLPPWAHVPPFQLTDKGLCHLRLRGKKREEFGAYLRGHYDYDWALKVWRSREIRSARQSSRETTKELVVYPT